MPKLKTKLSERETKALVTYIVNKCQNITQACLDAGYPPKSAYKRGSELLQKPLAKAFLEQHTRQVMAKYDKTADDVLKEMVLMAFSDIGNYFEPDGEDGIKLKNVLKMGKERRAIKKIKHKQTITKIDETEIIHNEYDYELWDKQKALRDLGEFHKLFNRDNKPAGDETIKGPVIVLPDNGKGGKAVVAVQWENK